MNIVSVIAEPILLEHNTPFERFSTGIEFNTGIKTKYPRRMFIIARDNEFRITKFDDYDILIYDLHNPNSIPEIQAKILELIKN